jgi:energy-coupling factor transporter ATP-binding protein EcfA2
LTGEVSDATRWLDQFDRVVAAAAQHLPDDTMNEIAAIASEQRQRRAYAGNVLLVGLAGGTGSGKSSLLNALADEEVSPSGAIRPTTAEALAWVPTDYVSRLEGLFERFGIVDVVAHDLDQPIAIIDLPDVDSVHGHHRETVAGLLPIIDLVIWVVDPEKYRDRVLHSQHLAPLMHHHERFRFVFNQIDRVENDDIAILVADLAAALRADGVRDPVIWVAAADPPLGPPIGVEVIWEELIGELKLKSENDTDLASELRRGLDLLAPHVRPIGFGARWDHVRQAAAGLWAAGRRAESARELRAFVIELSSEAAEIDSSVDLDLLIGSPAGDQSGVGRHLDATLGRYLRDRLRPRATTRALSDELVLLLPPLD